MEFTYTAIRAGGGTVKERLEADTEDQAIRRLQTQGYVVLSMEAGAARRTGAGGSGGSSKSLSFGPSGGFLQPRVKLEQVAVLSRELAIMLETGVPVTEALESLAEHADSPVIKNALLAANKDLSEGRTISQAIEAHPRVFPKLYVDMIRTAEAGNSLDTTLGQAADYLEAALEMRRKVVSALTYPAVLLIVAVGVLIFMMTYLVPQFSQMFDRMGAAIPPTTKFLLAASIFLRTHWWTIPATLIGGVWGVRAILGTPAGKDMATRITHKIPVIGDIVKKVAMARMLRALGTLTGTGVALLVALETSGQTAQNSVYERAMERMRTDVEQGVSLSDAVKSTRVFPPMVCQMMAVGEKSGRLSNVLLRVAQFYERDVDARLKMLTSIVEPVMIVVLGLMVGFIAVSIISPIYSLVEGVK